MFTIEINGRAIAVTDASEQEAQQLIAGEDFLSELKRLRTDEGPVWDGAAKLTLRPATEDEIEEFEEPELDEEGEEEEDEDEDEAVVMFLVPIIDDEEEED